MDDELLGFAEVRDALGITSGALAARMNAPDFPSPVAILASGRVWRLDQIVAYARTRCESIDERPEVRALAELGR